MWTGKTVRAAATGVLIALMAVPALSGVAVANDVPPPAVPPPAVPPPAPPVNGESNVRACELAYTQVRAEVISEFRAKLQAALNANDLPGVGALAVTELNEGLTVLRYELAACLARVLPNGAPRAGVLAAMPKHRRGGGGGSGSSCLGAFDKAVKKAARAEDRSFRKKQHTVTPDVAAVTFNAAVSAAAQRLQSCVGA